MPIPSPFHSRTAPLSVSHEWRDWSGYLAASLYEISHEHEYYAVRNSAGLFDVSPLFKYDISGPDALTLVNRVMTRNLARCAVGQVYYSPWCNDDGKLIDDGTITRLAADRFRITAADPNLRWFQDCGFGLQATVRDITSDLAALALQGPKSGAILQEILTGVDLDALKFFHYAEGQVDGFPIGLTRTGFTGDLGYELWVAPQHAERLWDMLLDHGYQYVLAPAGMVALDLLRIEASFPLIDVDYIPAPKTLIKAQTSSPYEVGMGWAVALSKENFVGRKALVAERERGSTWAFVGLEAHWPDIEAHYQALNLTPTLAGRASRDSAPVYRNGEQIGQATSRTYSPLLKKYIALATLKREQAEIGSEVDLELTVEFTRHTVRARVVKLPFFDPQRKRA
jgi:aminomethyltransferase